MLECGIDEEAREVEQLEKLAGLETKSDDENDQTVTNAEISHANEQFPVRLTVSDAVCRINVGKPDKYWSNLDNSLSSSGEESEDEELEEFAKRLEIEVNVEEPVSSGTIGRSGCIEGEDFASYAYPLLQRVGGVNASQISTPLSGCETQLDNVDDDGECMDEAIQEDSDEESLPDPEHYATSADEAGGRQKGEVGSEDDAETDFDERQQLLETLAEAKAARVTRGEKPERKEVTAAGLTLDLQFSSIVKSYFATEEERPKFESIETSKKEAKELARVQFEATQLADMQVAPMRRAKRGGLIWCYKKQLKEFMDEKQGSGEAGIGQDFVEEDFVEEERVWSRRNPGRGTKRRRFQHYKDFITLRVCSCASILCYSNI